MRVVKTIKSLRAVVSEARDAARTIGLVPTMGALHEGHISLIDRAGRHGDFIVVSIFVNPTQFGPKEDFGKYPRTLREDLRICRERGVDAVFLPSVQEMYPQENLTWINVEKLAEPLCGQLRPGHFRGVATVCAKLFNIVTPDVAYFGQKDAQQAAIIKKMVADLDFPLKIMVCPTIRANDGLALSSRNKYLSPAQRSDALCIYRSLMTAREMIEAGVTNPKTIIGKMRKIIGKAESLTGIDYISIVDSRNLQGINRIKAKVLIAVAARFGSTRLIDNILVDSGKR